MCVKWLTAFDFRQIKLVARYQLDQRNLLVPEISTVIFLDRCRLSSFAFAEIYKPNVLIVCLLIFLLCLIQLYNNLTKLLNSTHFEYFSANYLLYTFYPSTIYLSRQIRLSANRFDALCSGKRARDCRFQMNRRLSASNS